MAAAVAGAALLGKGLDISLAALQQHDPYISSIVDVASQVALYTFGHRANEWVREAAPPRPLRRERRGGATSGPAHSRASEQGAGGEVAPPLLWGRGGGRGKGVGVRPWLRRQGGCGGCAEGVPSGPGVLGGLPALLRWGEGLCLAQPLWGLREALRCLGSGV